ncbi:hypothetical protein DH2020_015494 [Rehmannia glutinosa]|uniref:Uncharacterized protein n=1 Tax=Rehmannia glutinosa TaxID=99300 RepID=A0ABR0WSY7_REHGL
MQRSRRKCESTSMGSIVLDLRPGLGIGPFSLGMPICEAFAQIEQQPNIYDVVHVKYYDEEPLKLDIVISFLTMGFILGLILGPRGPSTLATFVAVYALFGPTYPGVYDKDRSVYTLFYPGLSFAFPIPSQYADCCHNREAELPLEFPDGTTPVTCRVSVYDSSTDRKVGVGSSLVKACIPPLAAGSLYMEEVQVKVKYFLPLSTLGKNCGLQLGVSIFLLVHHLRFAFRLPDYNSFYQRNVDNPDLDVWTELGRPCGIHQKQTHKIKKFVLHTNYPGHSDFNSYMKCNFVICISDYGGSLHQNVNTSKCAITPSTKWEQVKEILGDSGRAAIQTQGSTSNPFGSTFVYGYPNVAFEEHALLVYSEIMKL